MRIPTWLSLLLKTAVSCFAIYYIWNHLVGGPNQDQNFASNWEKLLDRSIGEYALILVSALLIPLNFGLEALKWRMMIHDFYPKVSIKQAFQAVLAGNTTGIFTPNRVGEYAGRVLSLPQGHRIEAAALTFVDRIGQMIITLWLGFFAGIWLWVSRGQSALNALPMPYDLQRTTIILTGVAAIFSTLLFLNPYFLLKIMPDDHYSAWVNKLTKTIKALNVEVSRKIFGLSALRNLIFTTQYLLVLYALGMPLSIIDTYSLIWIVYLIKSVVPSISLSELGIRESVAIAIMEPFGVNSSLIVVATITIYFFNIALPALVGTRYVYDMEE